MGKELNKIKLLFLHDIFTRQTDSEHVYSANELCELLSDYGISCERKSIYSDIEALKEYGMDIVNVRTPKRGYYLNNRKFDIAEVRLLIDAVQAAKFISSKKTKALIYKIGSLLSEYQEEELREQIYVDSSFKSEKEDLYDIIRTSVVFRLSASDEINKLVRRKLIHQDGIVIGQTVFENKVYLKFTLLNPLVTHQKLDELIEEIKFLSKQ